MKNEITKSIWQFTLDNLEESQFSNVIKSTIKKALDSIDNKITNKTIIPDLNNPKRIGILAFTANPIHWGHIASSLVAVDELNLSTLFFLIQGDMTYKKLDDSQKMPKQLRHDTVKKVCEYLSPIIRYSNVGFDNDVIGEFNNQKIIKQYPDAEFFYYTGSETTTRIDAVSKNLATAQENSENNKVVTLAILPIGELMELDEYIKTLKYPTVVFGRDYNCELHSTQYRNGEKSIVPKIVTNMIN